jgi:hypothetical protein
MGQTFASFRCRKPCSDASAPPGNAALTAPGRRVTMRVFDETAPAVRRPVPTISRRDSA